MTESELNSLYNLQKYISEAVEKLETAGRYTDDYTIMKNINNILSMCYPLKSKLVDEYNNTSTEHYPNF